VYKGLVSDYVWADWPNSQHQRFQLDREVNLNNPLPFANAEFETILLSDVLEHIAEPDQLFREMVRILRPGGYIILGVPFMFYLHEEPHDYFRYTKFKLADFATKNGVVPVEIKEVGGAFDTLSELASLLVGAIWKPLARVPYHGWLLAKKIPAVQRLNARGAWRFPLAYIAVYRKP
jgi:SAM-dependent methyltransferase